MVKIAKKLTLVITILLVVSRCANQLPPGGGDVDKIPPEIVETYPLKNTINYDENYFEIEFSEYVDKRSFNDALFISPNIEGKLIFDWTGTTVTVGFEEGLETDITYTVTIGTDLVDRNNKNRMSSTYSFAFSTGETIDRRSISGKVYSSEPEGILIYAYKLDEGADTLINRKPNYVSQTGNDGTFELNGLGNAVYRLFAVKDEYRDLLYTLDQDMIGVPNMDISLTGQDTVFTGINFKLFKADTTAPRLLKGIMTDEKHILLTVSEEPDKSVINVNNFYLFDSTENKQSHIYQIFKKYGKTDEIVLVANEQFNTKNAVYLFAGTLSDSSHNSFLNDFVQLTISNRPDTLPVNIAATIPADKNTGIDFENPKIKIFFNDAVLSNNIEAGVSFTDTLNNSINFILEFTDGATMNIVPSQRLIPEKDYIIKCNLNYFKDISGNSQDSVYQFRFKTFSGLDYTGITGSLIGKDSLNNAIIVLENMDKSNLSYQLKVEENDFSFNEVDAGKYRLWCYFDADSNNQFNYGWSQPIEYSEKFFVYPDTLKLKPRWVVTDVLFNIK
jgi:hypothetical protein